MGVAEENFEGAFGLGRDLSTLGQLYDDVGAFRETPLRVTNIIRVFIVIIPT